MGAVSICLFQKQGKVKEEAFSPENPGILWDASHSRLCIRLLSCSLRDLKMCLFAFCLIENLEKLEEMVVAHLRYLVAISCLRNPVSLGDVSRNSPDMPCQKNNRPDPDALHPAVVW